MSGKRSVAEAVAVALDPSSRVPLFHQLYLAIRERVIAGTLRSGLRLPSSRRLALELHISRNTVVVAYEQLFAEGYLQGFHGAGTFISPQLPGPAPSKEQRSLHRGTKPRFSQRGHAILRLAGLVEPPAVRPFRHGLPALDEFPKEIWSRLCARFWRDVAAESLGYGALQGRVELRSAIADYLAVARGISCDARNVLVLNGTQQALYLSALALLDVGDLVWLEDPGYLGARAAFLAAGADLLPVPVDEEGLDFRRAGRNARGPKVIYTTPSNQYPSTRTMSLRRRIELLHLAARKRAWIIEDDYDSEFRYSSRPLSALKALDDRGVVIYIGSFSKFLTPSLRLGYAVVPDSLMDVFLACSGTVSRTLPAAEQVVLARFIQEGHLARHIRKMKTTYSERRDALSHSASIHAGEHLAVIRPDAGCHALAILAELPDKVAAARARKSGVECRPLSQYCMTTRLPSALVLGFGAFTPKQIDTSMQHLARALAG